MDSSQVPPVAFMTEEFAVRPATVDDIPTLARHRAGMFTDMGELSPSCAGRLVERSRRYLETAIPSGEYVGWLAAPDTRPEEVVAGVGMQVRSIIPRPDPSGTALLERQGLILNVYTEPAWRRRGLASLLMRHVLDWARENGITNLVLHASEDGRALYERLGFHPTNEMRFVER